MSLIEISSVRGIGRVPLHRTVITDVHLALAFTTSAAKAR